MEAVVSPSSTFLYEVCEGLPTEQERSLFEICLYCRIFMGSDSCQLLVIQDHRGFIQTLKAASNSAFTLHKLTIAIDFTSSCHEPEVCRNWVPKL